MDWYIAVNNQAKIMPENVLIYKIENDEISSETLVVNAEIENWVPLKETKIWREHSNECDKKTPADLEKNSYNQKHKLSQRNTVYAEMKDRGLGLSITGFIFSIIGLLIMPIVFSVLGFVLGIIVLSITSPEGSEIFKSIWDYRNKARGFGVCAVTLGAGGMLFMLIKMFLYNRFLLGVYY